MSERVIGFAGVEVVDAVVRSRRRVRGRLLLAILGTLVVFLAAWLDWLHPARVWPRATGWDRLPPAERAAPTVELWTAQNGETPPRLYWLGHAGFVLLWQGLTLAVDPNASARCTLAKRQLEPCLMPRQLGRLDAVLISHAHYDHLDLPTLNALDVVGVIAVPAGAEVYLPATLRPRARIAEIDGSGLEVGPLKIFAVPAAHNGNRFHPLASRQQAVGWVVEAGGEAIYFAGDTGASAPFTAIRERFKPRVAVLPIGAYSPRLVLAPYHLSPEEAVDAALELGVETVIPAHFGTFTLFLDRPAAALPRFARAAHRRGVHWAMPSFLARDASWPPTARGEPS